MAFPGTRQWRNRWGTAKAVVDELGKGQEVLRHSPVFLIGPPGDGGGTVTGILLIPDVDIRVVAIRLVGQLLANWDIDIITPTLYDTAPAAGNRIMEQIDSSTARPADDTVTAATLTNLNNRIVRAEQPIILFGEDDTVGVPAGTIEAVVQYVLADEARSY